MFNNVLITGVGTYHPEKLVDNEFFINHFKKYQLEEHAEGIMNKLGRDVRTIAREDETSISMSVEAAKVAINSAGLTSDDLDMIISVSDTPEYLSPCCALLIKNKLHAENVQGVFDMNCNCIGMLTAMDTALRYLKTDMKYKRILIVGSLLISPNARKDDMVAFSCTGDGAAAIILERKEESIERGLLGSRMYTDDNYYWSITMPACGLSKINDEDTSDLDRKMLWKPFDFSFLADKWSELITNVLADYGYQPKDVTQYFMSQFSLADLKLTMDKLGADTEDYIFIADKYGYTGCTSPIMALDEKLKQSKFNRNDISIFCSVASGYSMIALLYKW